MVKLKLIKLLFAVALTAAIAALLSNTLSTGSSIASTGRTNATVKCNVPSMFNNQYSARVLLSLCTAHTSGKLLIARDLVMQDASVVYASTCYPLEITMNLRSLHACLHALPFVLEAGARLAPLYPENVLALKARSCPLSTYVHFSDSPVPLFLKNQLLNNIIILHPTAASPSLPSLHSIFPKIILPYLHSSISILCPSKLHCSSLHYSFNTTISSLPINVPRNKPAANSNPPKLFKKENPKTVPQPRTPKIKLLPYALLPDPLAEIHNLLYKNTQHESSQNFSRALYFATSALTTKNLLSCWSQSDSFPPLTVVSQVSNQSLEATKITSNKIRIIYEADSSSDSSSTLQLSPFTHLQSDVSVISRKMIQFESGIHICIDTNESQEMLQEFITCIHDARAMGAYLIAVVVEKAKSNRGDTPAYIEDLVKDLESARIITTPDTSLLQGSTNSTVGFCQDLLNALQHDTTETLQAQGNMARKRYIADVDAMVAEMHAIERDAVTRTFGRMGLAGVKEIVEGVSGVFKKAVRFCKAVL